VLAVVFGPGRIGCGLVGLAPRAAGHEVTFVGCDPNLVAHLRRVGGYRVLLTGGGGTEVHEVDGVACMDLRDDERVTWIVPGSLVSNDSPGCVRCKLFVFGAGHAAVAYLGALKGYRFINAAVHDPDMAGPARAAAAAGVTPRALVLTAAAALVAANPAGDPSQTRKLLRRVCRLSPRRGLGHQVWQRRASLADGGGRQAVLLSLTRPTWAARPASSLPLRGRPA